MKKGIILICLWTLWACNHQPKEIQYGMDSCHYCSMNVVDQQHAAQIVTQKGRTYIYDAIECMMNDKDENPEAKVGSWWVIDYSKPTVLTNGTQATYLVSEAIPSPMGAYLSAFGTGESAIEVQKELGGEILNWNELKTRYGRE